MADAERLADVARRFADPDWFRDSPLYSALARTVAQDPELVALAAESRPGQQPQNMLMAAAHLLVLRDPSQPLARFFPSAGGDGDPAEAGPVFAAFCREHREVFVPLLRTRLVQTNAAGRGVAVRLALHAVRQRVDGPIALVEVGASAGIQLCFDRWAADVGGRSFGPPDAPVRLACEWRGESSVPDLGDLPEIATRVGVDLHPVDVTDPEERAWLRALVWPEDAERAAQLEAALAALSADPPRIVAGDAIEALGDVVAPLPADLPVVVWHSAVRMHVPPDRRAALDAAITAVGDDRRLLHVPFEFPETGKAAGFLLRLVDSRGESVDLALGHGHGRWLRPLGMMAA